MIRLMESRVQRGSLGQCASLLQEGLRRAQSSRYRLRPVSAGLPTSPRTSTFAKATADRSVSTLDLSNSTKLAEVSSRRSVEPLRRTRRRDKTAGQTPGLCRRR